MLTPLQVATPHNFPARRCSAPPHEADEANNLMRQSSPRTPTRCKPSRAINDGDVRPVGPAALRDDKWRLYIRPIACLCLDLHEIWGPYAKTWILVQVVRAPEGFIRGWDLLGSNAISRVKRRRSGAGSCIRLPNKDDGQAVQASRTVCHDCVLCSSNESRGVPYPCPTVINQPCPGLVVVGILMWMFAPVPCPLVAGRLLSPECSDTYANSP